MNTRRTHQTTHALVAGALLAATTLLAGHDAEAGRCHRAGMGIRLPISLGLNPDGADLGSTPSACATTSFFLEGRGTAFLASGPRDNPGFYGTLLGEVLATGSYAFSENLWLSYSLTPFRYRFVQNVSVAVSEPDFGNGTLGIHGVLARGTTVQLAGYVRMLLPLEFPRAYAVRTGVEPGIAFIWSPLRRVTLHASASLPLATDFIGSRALVRFGARASGDVALAPWDWFEFLLGMETRVGTDAEGALEYVAPRVALRFHTGSGGMFQLTAMLPLAGLDRTDLRFALAYGATW